MTQHADKYCLQGRAPRFITVRACVCGVLAIYACLHTYSVYVRARPCELCDKACCILVSIHIPTGYRLVDSLSLKTSQNFIKLIHAVI